MRDFAHGVWTALAITLAAPLRKAYDDHVDRHGCGCTGWRNPEWCTNPEAHGDHPHRDGIAWCDEAYHLAGLLPAGELVIVA